MGGNGNGGKWEWGEMGMEETRNGWGEMKMGENGKGEWNHMEMEQNGNGGN